MRYPEILALASLCVIIPNISALCADSATVERRVGISMPRLKITSDWIQEHPGIKIPQKLLGQTLSIVAVNSGTTLLQAANGKLLQVEGIIEGNESRYEASYNEQNQSYLDKEFEPIPVDATPFETLNLPPFRPFFGAFKGGSAYGGSFTYGNSTGGIEIMVRSNWTKRGIRPGPDGVLLTVFTVPIQLFNKTPSDISGFAPKIYLEDRLGNKYFTDPKNPKQGFLIPTLPSRKQIQIDVQIEAPADDFYLRPKIETKDYALYLGALIGPYDWEAKALEKNYSYPTPEEIEKELLKCLGYTSTKSGYVRILSRLSFIWLRTGRYADALSITGKLLDNPAFASFAANEDIAFIRRQQIIASIKSHQFRAAMAALKDADEKVLPSAYRDYLIRSCLRQVETEDTIDHVAQNPGTFVLDAAKAKALGRGQFDAAVIVTPFAEDAQLSTRLANLGTIQGQYDEARLRYMDNQRSDAKAVLIRLADASPEETVSLGGNIFKVAPAALDMLGRIYLREGNVSQALDCFRRMEKFPNDVFNGPVDGEGYYGGPAGAQALTYQAQVYAADQYFYPDSSKGYKDCQKVLELSKKLSIDYGSIMKPCWEECSTYGKYAAMLVDRCLRGVPAESKLWDDAIDFFVRQSDYNEIREKFSDILKTQASNVSDGVGYLEKQAVKFAGIVYFDKNNQTAKSFSLEALEAAIELDEKQTLGKRVPELKSRIADNLRALPETLPEYARTYLLQKYRAYLKQDEIKTGSLFDLASSTTAHTYVNDVDPQIMRLFETPEPFVAYGDISSPNIDVEEDFEGNIWIGTWRGVKVFTKDGVPVRFLQGKAPITADSKRKRVWINFKYFDLRSKELKNPESDEPPIYGGGDFRSFMDNGDVYTVDARGIFKYDDKSGRWIRIYKTDRGCNMAAIFGGKLYVARSDGLFLVDIKSGDEKSVYSGQVWDVVVADKNILLGAGNGFYVYNPGTDKLTDMTGFLPYKYGIRRIIVKDNLAFLATGNMHWMMDLKTNKIVDIKGTGGAAYYVHDALFSSNKIWTAGSNDVKMYDFETKGWSDFGKIVSKLPFQSGIQTKILFNDDSVWIAGNSSLERYNLKNKVLERISFRGNEPGFGYVSALGKYIAADNYLYDTGKKTVKTITMADGLPCVRASAAASDDREIWLACYDEEGSREYGEYRRYNPAVAIFDKQTGRALKSISIENPVKSIVLTKKEAWLVGERDAVRIDRGEYQDIGVDDFTPITGGRYKDIAKFGDGILALTDQGLYKYEQGVMTQLIDASGIGRSNHAVAYKNSAILLWNSYSEAGEGLMVFKGSKLIDLNKKFGDVFSQVKDLAIDEKTGDVWAMGRQIVKFNVNAVD